MLVAKETKYFKYPRHKKRALLIQQKFSFVKHCSCPLTNIQFFE